MNKLNLPLTPLELEKALNDIIAELQKRHSLNASILMNIYANHSRGSDLTSVLSLTEFNALFNAINAGFEISAAGDNKYLKILYASTEEIASDDYRAVKIVFVNDDELVEFTFTKFGTSIFLDSKTITAI